MGQSRVLTWSRLAALSLAVGLLGLLSLSLRPTAVESSSIMFDPESVAMMAPAPIDGKRAYKHLVDICAMGPRIAGTAANTAQRALVAAHFTKLGGAVREQPFTAKDPLSGKDVRMANLIGSWFPERTERVLLGVHYDTRPHPDMDQDPVKRKGPFLGANDGASGVALLMEIAEHLKTMDTPWGVDLVLFDGEELVYDQEGDYFLGSKEFAKKYAEVDRTKAGQPHYVAALVLDMIGDKDLLINQEPYSLEFAPNLVRSVWSVATRLRAKSFKTRVGQAVMDDHLPLNNAGIPAIDIIDFDYPHWHTAKDTPDKCSAESLEEVGRVVTAWLALPKTTRRR
ncbi:M28 family peptidase [Isosphaeraceae bacterium EP7]